MPFPSRKLQLVNDMKIFAKATHHIWQMNASHYAWVFERLHLQLFEDGLAY